MMKEILYNLSTKTLIKTIMYYKNSKYIPTSQYIKNNQKNQIFGEHDKERFFQENEFIKNKKLISISPGGYKGVYLLGVCMYIRDNFDMDNYIFTGSSAGAWNALLMTYKKDAAQMKHDIVDYSLQNSKTLYEIEMTMKSRLLQQSSTDDFDLRRLFVGVTTIHGYKANTTIFSGFNHLEDSIDCCIASSHIPLITGGFINKYDNKLSFDGGFSKYPYLNITQPVLHITPSMWNKKTTPNPIANIQDYTTLFSRDKFDFIEMYENGYQDAHNNRAYLKYVLDKEITE